MTLPIYRILWAGNRPSDHDDHLHVEAAPILSGTPPLTRPPMTAELAVIYDALAAEFGTPYYFHDPKPPAPNWSHMGWYNRRYVAGTTTWSQHAYSNALDIGPYYGKASQQKYYDFLTNQGDNMSYADEMTEAEVNAAVDWNAAFGQLKRTTQQQLMRKLVAIAQNYPDSPADNEGLQRGDTVKLV